MPNPTISVAMSVYNGELHLAEAIESILAQEFGDFEFLIVDDGSTDHSAEIIAKYNQNDPRIHPIYQQNKGLTISLNKMIGLARAPLIARMDADDIASPDRFSRQIAFMQANPEYAAIGTQVQVIDENGAFKTTPPTPQPLNHQDVLCAIKEDRAILCHPTMMVRKRVLQQIGGYREAFPYCEDYDLFLRLAEISKLGNLPETLLYYRQSSQQITTARLCEQILSYEYAKLSAQARRDNRPDPLDNIKIEAGSTSLNRVEQLFAIPGLSRSLRAKASSHLLHATESLKGDGWSLLYAHICEGGRPKGIWKTVLRLACHNSLKKAWLLFWALIWSKRKLF